MILGLSILLFLSMVALGAVWLSYRYQWRPAGVPRWPAPYPLRPTTRLPELTEIGVEAGPMPEPNYRTGEYPVVEAATEPAAAEPVEAEQVGPYRSRHAADEDLAEPSVKHWLRPTLHTEATPLFSATAVRLDLSETGSWMAASRAELLERLARDEEAAA